MKFDGIFLSYVQYLQYNNTSKSSSILTQWYTVNDKMFEVESFCGFHGSLLSCESFPMNYQQYKSVYKHATTKDSLQMTIFHSTVNA